VVTGSAGDSFPLLTIATHMQSLGYYVDCLADPVQCRLLCGYFPTIPFFRRLGMNSAWFDARLRSADEVVGFRTLASALSADMARASAKDWADSLTPVDTVISHWFCAVEQLEAERRSLRQLIVNPYPQYVAHSPSSDNSIARTRTIVSEEFAPLRAVVSRTRRELKLDPEAVVGPLSTPSLGEIVVPWDIAFAPWLPGAQLLGYPVTSVSRVGTEPPRSPSWPIVVTFGSHFGRAAENWSGVERLLKDAAPKSVLAVCVPVVQLERVKLLEAVGAASPGFVDLSATVAPGTTLVSHAGVGILHTALSLGYSCDPHAVGLDTASVLALFRASGLLPESQGGTEELDAGTTLQAAHQVLSQWENALVADSRFRRD
jgi:hypothetical protein